MPDVDATDLPAVCSLCSHNCGLRVDVAGGRIAAVRPDTKHPMTRGYICQKGYSLSHYVEHAQRVTHPLRRKAGGGFERISWDQAIHEIAAKLGDLRKRWTSRSIALLGCGGQGNHMDAVYALAFLQGLGSPHWFTAFAQEKTQHPLVDRWMGGVSPTSYFMSDAERSRYLVMLGTNPWLSHRGRCPRDLITAIQRDPTRTLVVVDPRRTETAARATLHLAIRPGTDCHFLLALAAEIVRRDLHDRAFLAERTRGFDSVAALLARADPRDLAARCGLSPDDIARVAVGLATERPASLFFDLGVEQTPFSTLNAYLMRLLSAMTGNLGRPGGNVYTAAPLAPRVDLASLLPQPRAPVSGIEAIPVLGPVGAFSPNLLPEEIASESPSRIRALIVEGANPLVSYADTKRYREAFGRLDLLVVIDPALTETAAEADYVLPTPVGYEKWEWSSFPNGYPEVYMQLRPPIVSAPSEALPEPEIYCRLAEAMKLFSTSALDRRLATRAAPLFQALAAVKGVARARAPGGALCSVVFSTYRLMAPRFPSPSLASVWILAHLFALTNRADVLRALPESVTERGPFALGETLFQRILDNPGGVEIARLDTARNLEDQCTFRDGRVRLALREMLGEIERALRSSTPSSTDYPLVLFTGERLWWSANTIHRDPSWRKGRGPHCVLKMHPADAAAVGVRSGDSVKIETRAGWLDAPCLEDDRLQIGHVSMPHGFGQLYPDERTGELVSDGVNVNVLTSADERDPFTGVPYHKYVRCRVRPS